MTTKHHQTRLLNCKVGRVKVRKPVCWSRCDPATCFPPSPSTCSTLQNAFTERKLSDCMPQAAQARLKLKTGLDGSKCDLATQLLSSTAFQYNLRHSQRQLKQRLTAAKLAG